ncbi:helix-turn-helix domain-containing protein [Spirosoma foliorum]|uniref:Helix-turn-helix transcriptional regulator n=1 Tax=Spirosoma foliorum TaxID=2710596 RepID=A0A7G5GVB7_9BACT|nr:AraC family transcriptional regulator [Spirosoma foliorum]QMW02809.1 helix-turn-helix transcriptional regulator [Spirosoma foliorum]
MKIIKTPSDYRMGPNLHNMIELTGVSLVESCANAHDKKAKIFLEDHLLLFVLEGTHHIRWGTQSVSVGKHQMVLLKKHTYFESHKVGNPDNQFAYESMMFFLKDGFLTEFVRQTSLEADISKSDSEITVKDFGSRMLKFLESLHPYFRDPEEINEQLFKLKMLELLYDLAVTDKQLLAQLTTLEREFVADLSQVIEANYLKDLSLQQLATLAGRSLSSFRRDFQRIYLAQPAQWLKQKKLEKALDLLLHTRLPISDVGRQVGITNSAHFTRVYKQHFGQTPSQARSLPGKKVVDANEQNS